MIEMVEFKTVSNVGLCMFKELVNIAEGNWTLK